MIIHSAEKMTNELYLKRLGYLGFLSGPIDLLEPIFFVLRPKKAQPGINGVKAKKVGQRKSMGSLRNPVLGLINY